MTEELFHQDARLHACSARITACTDAGIGRNRTMLYPLGNGVPVAHTFGIEKKRASAHRVVWDFAA